MIDKFIKINKKNSGSLLFELLIVISLLAVILSVGANAVYLSLRSNQISGERDTASALASESLEAVRAVTEENWHNIFSLTKNDHYHPSEQNGKWILEVGDEIININNIIYTRYIVIENVSRDNISRNIQNNYDIYGNDPSSQKVTVTVSWPGGSPISISEYFFRWKNKICNQSNWSSGQSSGIKNCEDTSHGGIYPAGTINTEGGQLKLQ